MFQKYLLILFLIGSSSLFGQEMKLRGVVRDSLQNPIPYTNVLATPIDTTWQSIFAITDEKGRYKLQLNKNVVYKISISHLGFEKMLDTIRLTTDRIQNYMLFQDVEKLDQVVLKSEMAIIVKEDTITYRTDKFRTGDERKLREILKKLPGVEVDRFGNVTVHGKKITKLMVNGEAFFGGSTQLGVNNIPADVVGEVEIIDDYHAVSFMKGLSDSDAMAMNIKLKKGKEHFVFGESQAGGGFDDRYYIKPSLFYYSPKTTVNLIASFNNIGEAPLSNDAVNRFRSGNVNVMQYPIASGDEGLSHFSNHRDILFQKTDFGAINFTQAINPRLKLSVYGILAQQKTTHKNTSEIMYLAQDNLVENRKRTKQSRHFSTFNKLKLRYRPSSKSDMAYNLLVNASNTNSLENIRSQTKNNLGLIRTDLDRQNVAIKQYFRYNSQPSYDHTSELKANYIYERSNGLSDWFFDRPVFPGIIPAVDENDTYNFLHDYSKTIHKGAVKYKHYWVLNSFNHIYPLIGLHYSNQSYNSIDFQRLDNGGTNNFKKAGFNNELDFRLLDPYIGMQYKFKINDLVFRPGLIYHHYFWKLNQFGIESINTNKGVFLPEFMAKYSPSSSEKIELNYQLKSSFKDVASYADRLRLTSFNQLFRGNSNLENNLYHEFDMIYRNFGFYQGLSFYVNLEYLRYEKTIQSTVKLEGINQVSSLAQTDFPKNSYGFSGEIRKKWNDYSVSLNASAHLNNYSRLINTEKIDYASQYFRYKLSGKTRFDNLPNLTLGISQRLSTSKSDAFRSKFMTINPYAYVGYYFLDGFIFKMGYRYTYYKNRSENQINRFQMGNASLYYRAEGSPWGFEVRVKNIFNVRYKNNNSFNEFIVYDIRTYIQPRTALFILSYQL